MGLATTVADTPCPKRARPFTTEQEITKRFANITDAQHCGGIECRPLPVQLDIVNMTKTPLMSLENNIIATPAEDGGTETPPHDTCKQDSTLLQAYQSMRVAQEELLADLGLADNDAGTLSQVTEWTLQVAKKYRLKRESVYGGLYLFYTYMAHVRRHGDMDNPFGVYKKRLVMNMHKETKFDKVVYEISAEFQQNMGRRKNTLLIAITCLCVASKMEECSFDKMLKPSRVIAEMRYQGHDIGRHKVYDFITVERDIVKQLAWRLFRVQTPGTFLNMLFHEFAVCSFDQQETHDLVCKCLTSSDFVLLPPNDLAAVCLMSALRKTYNSESHAAKLAQFVGLSVSLLLEHSSCILALRRGDDSSISIDGKSSSSSSSSSLSSSILDNSSSTSSVRSDDNSIKSSLYTQLASEFGDGAVDQVETL